MKKYVVNIVWSEFFFGGSFSYINYFVYLLVQFVIEIVIVSSCCRCVCYMVVFWVQLDVKNSYYCVDDIQCDQVEVCESCGDEIEVEEWYQVVCVYYIDNYCIINYDDYVVGDVQIVCDDFRNCIQYFLYFVGVYGDGNDNCWDSDMYCLQEQRRNVQSGECCQVVVFSCFVCCVLECYGDGMNDNGQYLVCCCQWNCQCDIGVNVLMFGDDQNGRDDGCQCGIRCNGSIDVYLVQSDYFQSIVDDNIGFYVFQNGVD